MGGWRPQILMEILYRQISFAIVRDPNNHSKTKLVTTITIEQNKRDKNKARTAQNEFMSFSVTIVPQPLLCVASLLVARAIKDKAFQVPFESLEDLLRQPHLDGVDYVPLAWREDILDEKIVPLKYHPFWGLWNRTFFVSGAREKMRPYSMRVGAGQRLAFENHISEDSDLFQFLQNACLGRDQNAPVYPSYDDLKGFELRQDIQDLRKKYANTVAQQSSACPEAGRISARISWIIDSLSDLRVEELRKEYFRTADSLRSQGLDTKAARDAISTSNPRQSYSSGNSIDAATIGRLLLDIGDQKPENATIVFSGMAVAFLRGHPLPTDTHTDALRSNERTKADGHHCLLCNLSLSNAGSLTRHTKRKHQSMLAKPFPCPECRRLGREFTVAAGGSFWTSHVIHCHGKANAPIFRSVMQKAPEKVECLLCNKTFARGTGLSLHFTKHHVLRGHLDNSFSCPACEMKIENQTDWVSHLKAKHPMNAVLQRSRAKAAASRALQKGMQPSVDILEATACSAAVSELNTPAHLSSRTSVIVYCDQKVEENAFSPEAIEWGEWDSAASLDPHANEEFWVEGWD
ncbi:hypothetical protein AK830_g11561 [Neonectria ditissima]|uniref:C2H2-type domain-containing protein n=1 Tax=Neonectria ditissima TaxID=78410 RepID=A0A0P7B2Y8_9HYPO|nr:hypothetical protein AK830_g11561 [Neonectria ditissima]